MTWDLDQPDPKHTDGPAIWDLVIADLTDLRDALSDRDLPTLDAVIRDARARDEVGRERYGTPLQAWNGCDPFADAYTEALDLVVYLRQAKEHGADVSSVYDDAIGIVLTLASLVTVGTRVRRRSTQ